MRIGHTKCDLTKPTVQDTLDFYFDQQHFIKINYITSEAMAPLHSTDVISLADFPFGETFSVAQSPELLEFSESAAGYAEYISEISERTLITDAYQNAMIFIHEAADFNDIVELPQASLLTPINTLCN